MPRFYFIDTNIILGHCNPLDRLHPVTSQFFKAISNKRHIFLLYSVEKEYYKKVRTIRVEFEKKIFKKLRNGAEPNLIDIKEEFLNVKENKNYYFEKYIFEIFKNERIENLSYKEVNKGLSRFISNMRHNFKQLIEHWIVRPKANDYEPTKSDPEFIKYRNRIGYLLHYPDDLHLALTAYVVVNRSPQHDYIFYTDDNQYIYNNLERRLNLPNLRIKKLPYKISTRLRYSSETESLSIKEEFIEPTHDEDLV